ncbi:MerR family transcriptional regulator [Kitasatospora sp. NPDC096147]|uniref:MerR family transcriptional regulator n=1 Tax=Kitasatospora sp. NPDC096147 TaxID=3364093 RepID=UPI00382B7DB0
MRIGELSRRTGVPSRLLRYYEEQGLLHPTRDPNGYRAYAPEDVPTVRRIRDLLAAGLPTEAIGRLLPCAHDEAPGVTPCTRSLNVLDDRLDSLAEQITRLRHQHELLTAQRTATADRAG